MPSWQETLIISAGMLNKFYGQLVPTADSGTAHVAVWPTVASRGARAEFVIIRPGAGVYMAVDETGDIGASVLVGRLEADTNYAFPIHPSINTLQFKTTSDTDECDVQVNWIVQR